MSMGLKEKNELAIYSISIDFNNTELKPMLPIETKKL